MRSGVSAGFFECRFLNPFTAGGTSTRGRSESYIPPPGGRQSGVSRLLLACIWWACRCAQDRMLVEAVPGRGGRQIRVPCVGSVSFVSSHLCKVSHACYVFMPRVARVMASA